MPNINGTTIFGSMLNITLPVGNLSQVALYFPRPLIPGLLYQNIGVLRLVQTNASQLIIVRQWDVTYPGIWPIQSGTFNSFGWQANFECWRPGLPFTFYYESP